MDLRVLVEGEIKYVNVHDIVVDLLLAGLENNFFF